MLKAKTAAVADSLAAPWHVWEYYLAVVKPRNILRMMLVVFAPAGIRV
jgi:hypothetical protein